MEKEEMKEYPKCMGMKIKSKGMGKGLGTGKGMGPIGMMGKGRKMPIDEEMIFSNR